MTSTLTQCQAERSVPPAQGRASRPHRLALAAVLALLAPLAATAQVNALANGSSLTGGSENFATLALGSYSSFNRSLGSVGYTANQLTTDSITRLNRITPSGFGPGFSFQDNLVFVADLAGVSISFSQPVNAFGAGAIGNITGGYAITMRFYDGNTLLGSVVGLGAAGFSGNTGVTFVGGQSTTAFNKVEIVSSGSGGFGFAMNGMAIGPVAAVPEPATAAMLAVGMLALGAVPWRRGRAGVQA